MRKSSGLKVAGVLLTALLCSGFGEAKPTLLIAFTDPQDAVHHFQLQPQAAQTDLLDLAEQGGGQAAVLAADHKRLYEASRDADQRLQLYEVNLSDKSRRQLTTQFARIDNLRLDKKHRRVYLRVLQKNHQNPQIAAYDLEKGAVQVWHADERDAGVQSFDVNPKTGDLLAWVYSLREEQERVDESHKLEAPMEPPHYKLLLHKDGEAAQGQLVGETERQPLDVCLSEDGRHALFAAVQWPLEERRRYTIQHADLTTGNSHTVLDEQGSVAELKQPQYAPDGRGFYFTATAPGSVQTDKHGFQSRPRALYRYDFKSKQTEEVWTRGDGVLNQYLLQR